MTDLTVGTAIAGFRVESLIGQGSMGTVYSAKDESLDRRVAIKVLAPELARDARFRERFLRESQLAASLEHPNIVPIHAAGEADGQLYLAMRYVDGRDLASLLRSLGRLDAERAVDLVAQVGSALDAAHARGLIHRDVKPANILLARHDGKRDHAYLCDFGLAKHASTVSSLTGDRGVIGTVEYLAPEQIEGRPVDGRVDVYALGCVLYELLTGEPPFNRGNELVALLAHVNDPPPKVSDRRSDVPDVFDDVIATALAKDRDLRYATCADLVEAARAALHGERTGAPVAVPETAAVRTFLFADVRGYTSYTREHGDESGAELAREFAKIVSQLAPQHHGALQELRGDEALVVFDSARAALRFALALQVAVVEEELARPVGIGLDAGEAVAIEDGFRGGALNRAARLCALAGPGDVLASDAVRELAGQTDGVVYGFRREERLKGFEKPVGVVEIHSSLAAPGRELGRATRARLLGTRPRRRALLAGLVAVVALGVALPITLLRGGAGSTGFRPGVIALLNARTLTPAGTFADVGAPDGLMSDSTHKLWALDISTASVARIDPLARKVTARFALNVNPNGMAWGAGSLWVADADHPAVVRYDPAYGSVSARISLPAAKLASPDFTNWLAYGDGSMWVSYGKWPFRIARIDPRTNRVLTTIDLQRADGSAAIAFGDGSLWVVSQDNGRIWRIDATTNAVVARGKLHDGWVEDIRVANGYAWLPVENDRAVWKVDSSGNVLKSITTGDLPYALGGDDGTLEVVNQKSATLSRIDTGTDEVTTTSVGHRPEAVAAGGGLLWIPLNESPADATVGLAGSQIIHIVTDGDPLFNTDPALTLAGQPQAMLQQTIGARLLRYPDRAEPQGATLKPEIADLPTVSADGRTYTFAVRGGYRFSPPSGASVTADSMRYTIERALSPVLSDPLAQAHYMVSDIEGVQAYRNGKTRHISGIRVAGNRLVIKLVGRAPDFPVRISLNWFSAVPLGTPILAHGVRQPIPTAGPYYISSHVGDLQEVLKRNPNYTGPRPHALDAFVFENGVGSSALSNRVIGGTADYIWSDGGQLAAGGALDRRFGSGSDAARNGRQRYFAPTVTAVRFLEFNTKRGPFTDPKLRRAVNYAIDRPALAAIFDSSPSADPIPPGVPGAGATMPFSLGAPDLAKAGALAGVRHRKVVLFVRGNGPDDSVVDAAAATIRRDLALIGMSVEIRHFDDPWGEAAKPGSPVDLLLNNWFADYSDPSNFVNELFDPKPLGYGYPVSHHLYRDKRLLNAMERANGETAARRPTAYRELVARMMRESPPSAVFAVPRGSIEFFSAKVGCQVFRPQDYGFVDLAALCLRDKG